MADLALLIDGYIATWNETDPDSRRRLIAQTFTDNADYVDPLMRGDGALAIDAMIAGVQEKYADYRFELVGRPDAHNDRVRFTWHLVSRDTGEPIAKGYDFGTVAADGRLQSVTGFLETPGH